MTSNLAAPVSNRSYAVLADWLELLALSRATGSSSLSELNDCEDVLFDSALRDEEVDESDQFDPDIVNVEEDSRNEAVYDEVRFRADRLKGSYPFDLVDDGNVFRLSLSAPSPLPINAAARDLYITCLLMSCVRFGILDGKGAGVPVDPQIGNLFQVIATAAAAGYMGGDAYLFGHPRPDKTSMSDAVRRISELLGSGTPAANRKPGTPMFAKDGGIDVVAWRDHVDGRPSKAMLFGQCASGGEWRAKPIYGDVEEVFGTYFDTHPTKHWLPAIFTPFQIYAENENGHDLHTEEARAGFYLQKERKFGLIIDRIRLVHWASLIWNNLPSATNESLSDLNAVWSWRDQALAAARAA